MLYIVHKILLYTICSAEQPIDSVLEHGFTQDVKQQLWRIQENIFNNQDNLINEKYNACQMMCKTRVDLKRGHVVA